MNSYTELVAAIRSYLHRGDVEPMIPTFIQLAEARFNRNLRLRQMEQEGTVAIVGDSGDLPDDWLEFSQGLQSDGRPFMFVPRDQWSQDYYNRRDGLFYTVAGRTLWASYDAASAGLVRFWYYAKIPPLAEGNPTNWLLEEAPDAYLYGALLEATPWLKDDKRISVWQGLLQVALNDLQAANDKAKYAAPLTMSMPR